MSENIKRFIDMRFHRNGIGGHGAIVTIFESTENDVMVATSLTPDLTEDLTPDAYSIERYGEQEAYAQAYLRKMATDTVVLTVEQVAAHSAQNAWRGADYYGPEIAAEWRRRCIASEVWPGQSGYDPAMEWYDEVHADPEEMARLIAENEAAIEEMFPNSGPVVTWIV